MRHRAVSTRPAAHPVVTSPHQWRTSAACLGEPLDLFFPTAVVGPLYGAQVAAAKAVCARCAVVAACRADALLMWISSRKRRIEQGIQVGDMSVTWPWPVPVVVPGAGR